MQLTEDVKNPKEVIKVLEAIPSKRLELVFEDGAFEEWITKKSKELGFEFNDYI